MLACGEGEVCGSVPLSVNANVFTGGVKILVGGASGVMGVANGVMGVASGLVGVANGVVGVNGVGCKGCCES